MADAGKPPSAFTRTCFAVRAAIAATCSRLGLNCVQLTPAFPGLGFRSQARSRRAAPRGRRGRGRRQCRSGGRRGQSPEPDPTAGTGSSCGCTHSSVTAGTSALTSSWRNWQPERAQPVPGYPVNRSPEVGRAVMILRGSSHGRGPRRLLLKPGPRTSSPASPTPATVGGAESPGARLRPRPRRLPRHQPAEGGEAAAGAPGGPARSDGPAGPRQGRASTLKAWSPRTGGGVLDYAHFFRRLARHQPDAGDPRTPPARRGGSPRLHDAANGGGG